jgi:predicted phosphoadenosine phosphosulfate sulfurtransferase
MALRGAVDVAGADLSGKVDLGMSVLDAALMRLGEQYEAGHRVVVSCSGGKDSIICAELAIIAARRAGRLPVEVVTREEEIIFPGTCEYLERLAARPEVSMTWLVAHQPSINAFDRAHPYWWVCDREVPEEDWVHHPPDWATHIPEQNIECMTIPSRFPPPPGKELRAVVGLRVQESRGRRMGLHMSGGHVTAPNRWGVRNVRPIYDWRDTDVWLAIQKHGWDYNDAYDVMLRFGVPRSQFRISPPTMNSASGDLLRNVGCRAWPKWWDRVCRRLPSVRTYAMYGKRAVVAERRLGETWEQCFRRTCITDAPPWIAERATEQEAVILRAHRHHASGPLPEVKTCLVCFSGLGSYRDLTRALYNGDPFSVICRHLPYVEPEYFRPGAGTWGGLPG